MSRKPQLAYQPSMWTEKLGDMPDSLTPDQKNHLLSSLLIHLDIRLADLLPFIFETRIEDIRRRAGSFMGYWQARGDSPARFPPAVLYTAWHQNFPKSRDHLHEMITPCAKEIALKESDRIINAKELKIRTKNVTSDTFSTVFTPGRLREFYQTNSPFIWGILETFAASPNRYRKRVERKKAAGDWEDVMDQDERDDDPDFDEDDPAAVRSQGAPELPGFSRDPDMAILISISAMTFARNRATNLLPTICGVFFKIEGTSSRVVRMLSNIGLSVSSKMVERIKENISDDAIRRARTLMKSGRPFVTVFDNLNFYLRKHQQRITNQNESLNVTNSAILGIPDEGIDVKKALNLDEHLKRRGQRKNARFQSDILPTAADGEYLQKAFKFIIAEFIVRYTPGSDKWEGRAAMLEKITAAMPHDEPLTPTPTDSRPFGVFNVNEGSKRGIVDLLDEIRLRAQMDTKQWSEDELRILGGDWLTSANIRAARRDRRDDETPMERLEYGQEVSELFHFALQATEMLMRTHYGDENDVQDPTSIKSHRGLVGRSWNINSANYSAAKSMSRHSLIARVLHIAMVFNRFNQWSQLETWRPTLEDVYAIADHICKNFTSQESMSKAREAGDDWNTHDRYFIRDVLLFCEFERAVSYADAPSILRVLRYWCLAFRGAGQHNYARECAEILLKWKYEISPELKKLLSRAWFVNRWGKEGCWIAADLYLEQLNLLVKRVFIAQGSGVTADYIIKKGSACVETFRQVSYLVSRYFGNPDRRRKSKELSFKEDLRVLVEDMERHQLHKELQKRLVPDMKAKTPGVSAIFDVMAKGAEIWQDGKWSEFLKATTYDEAEGYPIGFEPDANEKNEENIVYLAPGRVTDVLGEEDVAGQGGIGGGCEFDTGEEAA
ncbi:hypothetical protein DFP72DRAFT_1058761 [Ephemerocybe angulata]|uniref:DUF6589 domain-containing protein n=1 Tax=Ephemerocybe angulata TaxID=980116 RepID=A0A8H6MDV9_9AGAR|nr:hypothetical protein DFP72DRAFT_1058761 [Tulosesus angulatus]